MELSLPSQVTVWPGQEHLAPQMYNLNVPDQVMQTVTRVGRDNTMEILDPDLFLESHKKIFDWNPQHPINYY